MDAEGYLYITGRSREVIIRGGENIARREVEEVLETYSDVQASAVVGRPDPIFGEQVVAFIIPRGTWNEEIKNNLREYAAQRLSPHKVPTEFIVTDTFPRNATGKVERRVLRERAIQTMQQTNETSTK
jgi:acyl-coenzyme A synthetase/AMP-(fatty) acid ligase